MFVNFSAKNCMKLTRKKVICFIEFLHVFEGFKCCWENEINTQPDPKLGLQLLDFTSSQGGLRLLRKGQYS